ncbi:MAG: tRNA (adenosine(37)-N6)-dimethylallyltransferase MiaA [Candidatus Aminicenantes bacterium]|nr:tRNA (adenosine(37)-N6)-dimethylallyltransferase MiaA [Candidatus Aminicenantes bacterium]
MHSERHDLIVLLGPTAVGKSRAGNDLALKFNGEIINCDSMQVYEGFDIGTDKPTIEMRRQVPHHLVDILKPSAQFTAGEFVRRALAATRLIEERGRRPFIIGGTGLYLKALLEGLFPGPGRDEQVRRRLEQEADEKGLEALRRQLEDVDPDYARTVGKRDKLRIIRALEVHTLTGQPISRLFKKTRSEVAGFHVLKIGLQLERQELYMRIEERVDSMFRNGICEETKRLLAAGVPESAPPFRGLGYRRVIAYLQGGISLEEAKRLTKQDTRQYAKRQITWFRKMPGVNWFPGDDLTSIALFLESWLAS